MRKKQKTSEISVHKFAFLSACFIFCITILLSIGYAVFTESLEITGEATVRAESPIRFIENSLSSLNNGGIEKATSKYTVDTITHHIDLPNCDSTASYNVVIKNNNNFPIAIKSLNKESWNNPNIDFEIIGYNLNQQTIAPNSTVPFEIKFSNSLCGSETTKLDSILKFELIEVLEVNYSDTLALFSTGNNPGTVLDGNTITATFSGLDDSLIAAKINNTELVSGMTYNNINGEPSLFTVENGVATLTNVHNDVMLFAKLKEEATTNSEIGIKIEWVKEDEVIVSLNGTTTKEAYIRVSEDDLKIGKTAAELYDAKYANNAFKTGQEVYISFEPINGHATLTQAFTIKLRNTTKSCSALSTAELIDQHAKKNFDINEPAINTGVLTANAARYVSVYSAAGNTFEDFKFKIKFGLTSDL